MFIAIVLLGIVGCKETPRETTPKPDAAETHTIDLYDRKDKIEMPRTAMGFDNDEMWLMDVDNAYDGNPGVCHNLTFLIFTPCRLSKRPNPMIFTKSRRMRK